MFNGAIIVLSDEEPSGARIGGKVKNPLAAPRTNNWDIEAIGGFRGGRQKPS